MAPGGTNLWRKSLKDMGPRIPISRENVPSPEGMDPPLREYWREQAITASQAKRSARKPDFFPSAAHQVPWKAPIVSSPVSTNKHKPGDRLSTIAHP
jgi:hypothetical protein